MKKNNGKNRKFERKDKNEKRRLALEKQNARRQKNMTRYGADNGAALVVSRTSDFNRRFVAAFLALVFAISTMVLGLNFATKADDSLANLTPTATTDPESGMVLSKYLTPNSNGNYDLTMEAYTTADEVEITEKIPTDFVVVVDQSGSMDTADMPTGTATVQNNKYLETIANGQYYYKDGDNYYRVYGVKDYLYRYYPANFWFTGDIVEHLGTDIGWFMGETDATTDIDNAFYFREVVNGTTYYTPIKTTIQGKIGTYVMRFQFPSKITGNTYKFDREVTTYSSNGNSPWYKNVLNGDVMTSGALWSTANGTVQAMYPNDNEYTYSTINLLLARPRTGMYINYPMYGRHLSYTKLCYRDVDGVEHTLPSNQSGQTVWEYCDDNGIARTTDSVTSARPTYSGLYTFSGTTTRIAALKAALNEFAEAVANETDYYGSVDNKISIVGFSSSGYSNTEVLTKTDESLPSTYNGWQKATADGNVSEYYGKALVDSTNGTVGTVNGKITSAINALTANGGTQPEDGLDMAYKILTNRSTTTYTIRSGSNKGNRVDRNKIVIFFTDGQPGDYHYSDQYAEANDVVEAALPIKQYGASLFSIGVFGESDGNPLTYTHATTTSSSTAAAWKYLGGWMETYQNGSTYYCLRREWRPNNDDYTETANDTIFDYMSVTSSNYPDAEDYIAPAWLDGTFSGNYIAATDGDTVRHKSTAESTNKYYRMASNQDTLVAAFLQAVTMHNDDLDPTTIDMNGSTVLKDFINTTDFVVGSNPTITYETENITMTNGVVSPVANSRTSISGLTTDFTNNTLSVSGYDYTDHYVAEGRQGQKLIVTLQNVYPASRKTSATDILRSNTNASGIYNSDDDLVLAFPQPSISRHSYTLDVKGDNPSGQFNVVSTIVDSNGTAVSANDPALSDVIVVAPDGTRSLYSSSGGTSVANSKNGDVFYYENVPDDYKVKTSVTAQDNQYTYTMYANEDTGNTSELRTDAASDRKLDYEDSILHITSVANTRSVTIRETVDGSFANDTDKFTPTLYLVPPEGQQVPAEGATYSGINWEKDGTNNRLKYTTRAIQGNNNDSVSLTVPANWKLIVEQTDSDYYEVTDKEYVLGTSGTSTDIPAGGVDITDNLTITITNTRDNIPITGVDDHDTYNWVIYLLVAIAGIAVVGTGIFLWKKKDEFVEE